MASIQVRQDDSGPFVDVPAELATEVRRALFQAAIPFQEEPEREGRVVVRFDDDVSRATLLRALEALP